MKKPLTRTSWPVTLSAPTGRGEVRGVSKPSAEWNEVETPSYDVDVDAFARAHQAELLHFFRGRVSHAQDAADLAQESWSRLMRYRHGRTAESLRKLLFAIARNVLSNHWRWRALRQIEESTDFSEVEVASASPDIERQWQGRRHLEILEATVAALPAKRRTVFLLSRVEGLSNAQVAQRCGISVKMVEKHLAKAIVQCRAQVGDFDL